MQETAKTEKMVDRMEKMAEGELPNPPIAQLIGHRMFSMAPGESHDPCDA